MKRTTLIDVSHGGHTRKEDIGNGREDDSLGFNKGFIGTNGGTISIIVSNEEKSWNWVNDLFSSKFIFRS